MIEIHHLCNTMSNTITQPKFLRTQVPLFKRNRDNYNEFQHLLLNHLRPHSHKLTEDKKLNYFLLRDDAIKFWQTFKTNTETTLRDILVAFKKEALLDSCSTVNVMTTQAAQRLGLLTKQTAVTYTGIAGTRMPRPSAVVTLDLYCP